MHARLKDSARGLAQWRARCALRSPDPPNRNPVPGRHRVSGLHLGFVEVGKIIRRVVRVGKISRLVGVGGGGGGAVAGGGVLVGGKRVGLGAVRLVGTDVEVGGTGGRVAVGGGTAVAEGLTRVGLGRSVAAVVGTGVADGGA